MKHLVMIHGRSQQLKDSDKLKASWVEALAAGLHDAGRSLDLDESKIHFPYYGDTLIDLMTNDPDPAAVVVKGVSEASSREQDFSMIVLKEILLKNGVTDAAVRQELEQGDASQLVKEKGPLNWPWILAGLRVLDRINAGAWSVSTFTHDVWVYLTDKEIRQKINNGVSQAYRGEPAVFLSHSLGTIVAYDVLKSDYAASWKVPALITLGSPLGIETIWHKLRPLDRPLCLDRWMNGRDPQDTVALYPLVAPSFPVDRITSKDTIHNISPNHHGIESYLADSDVAGWLHEALQD